MTDQPQSPVLPSQTPVPTPRPKRFASPTPTPEASASPIKLPPFVPDASSEPSSVPSPTVSLPAPAVNSDISVIERTTLNGKVYDDSNAPLDGVTIKVKSINPAVPYEASTDTAGGSYVFQNVPAGVTLEIQANKLFYTPRRRFEVLKSNKEGKPDANRFDFGNDGSSERFGQGFEALSDKPEVVLASPSRMARNVQPGTSFMLKFSEPMDRASVEENFEILAFTTRKFSVDTRPEIQTVIGSESVDLLTGTKIWDKNAFKISWANNDTEVSFSFANELALPSDKDANKTPEYQISLNRRDGIIKDKNGIRRGPDEKKFKLTGADFERSYSFSLQATQAGPGPQPGSQPGPVPSGQPGGQQGAQPAGPPGGMPSGPPMGGLSEKTKVESIRVQTAENSGPSGNGDLIKLGFSKRMIYYTQGVTIAGGMGGMFAQAAAANNLLTAQQAAANYRVTVVRNGTPVYQDLPWSLFGGRAIFDTSDPLQKTVLLLPAQNTAPIAFNGVTLNSQALTATGHFRTNMGNNPINMGMQPPNGGSDDQAEIQMVRLMGPPVFRMLNLAENLPNSAAVAADLQTRLNAAMNGINPPTSPNPFSVSYTPGPDETPGNADDTLTIRFNDLSNNYFGWRMNRNFTGTGPILPAGAINFAQGAFLDIYRPGDIVSVKVERTVSDPSGEGVEAGDLSATAQ